MQCCEELLIERIPFAVGCLFHIHFGFEPASLFDRIGQLSEAVGEFHPASIELEALGEARIAGQWTRQGGLFGRIFAEQREPTLPQLRFDALDKDTIATAIAKIADAKATDAKARASGAEVSEAQRTIDMLERRISKLTHALGVTEEELQRIAAMKGVDLGVASIYRNVQGLSDESADKERKKEMMKTIFQANFELKKHLTSGPAPGAQS